MRRLLPRSGRAPGPAPAGTAALAVHPDKPVKRVARCPPGGAADVIGRIVAIRPGRDARPAGGGRQPHRRRWRHRCRGARLGRARRLHAADGHADLALDQGHAREGLPAPPPARRLRAGHGGRKGAAGGGESDRAGADAGRAGGLSEGRSGQAGQCLVGCRRAAPHGGRDPALRGRHPHAARALQGQRAGHDRPRRLPGRHHGRDRAGGAAVPWRPASRGRQRRPRSASDAARGADGGRSRHAGRRHRAPERRAGQDADAVRCQGAAAHAGRPCAAAHRSGRSPGSGSGPG